MKYVLAMWALGYPLVCCICGYINAKTRAVENRRPSGEGAVALNEVFQFLVWVIGCLVIMRK